MKARRSTVAGMMFAALTVAVMAPGAPASAGPSTYCAGTGGAVTVPGDLIVAAGHSCELDGTRVTGDVIVNAGGNLLADRVAVAGDLVVRIDGFAGLERSSVAGDVRARSAYGMSFGDSELDGTVNARQSGFLYSRGTVHAGEVVSNEGATLLESSLIDDRVRTSGDAFTDLFDTIVDGKVQIATPVKGAAVCASEIGGTTRITGAAGPVGVGADSSGAACGPVTFAGDLHLLGNRGGVSLAEITVYGKLACSDNRPGPVGERLRLRGTVAGQCKALSGRGSGLDSSSSGAASSGAASSGAASGGDDRRAVLAERIEQRTAVAEDEAMEAGPAF